MLLPPAEALKRAGHNAMAEIRTRRSLVKTGRVPSSSSAAGGGTPGIDALVSLLMDHSAPKLAARVVLGSAHLTRSTSDSVVKVAQALVDAATARKHPDFQLALGALMALPQREAFKACSRLTVAVRDDFERLAVLSRLGAAVASAWGQDDVAKQYAQRLAEAEWWRKLERLSIPFNGELLTKAAASARSNMAMAGEHDDETSAGQAYPAQDLDADAAAGHAHAQNLLMPLIHNTGGDLEGGRAFCVAFGIPPHYANALFAEFSLVTRPKLAKVCHARRLLHLSTRTPSNRPRHPTNLPTHSPTTPPPPRPLPPARAVTSLRPTPQV